MVILTNNAGRAGGGLRLNLRVQGLNIHRLREVFRGQRRRAQPALEVSDLSQRAACDRR